MNAIIRLTIFLLSLSLLLLSCNNQNNNGLSQPQNDSIKKYLELASNDTLPFPQRNVYNKKAFSFIDLSKNDTLTRWYLNKVTYGFLTIKNWGEYNYTSKKYLENSILNKDTLNLARYYRYRGSYFRNIDKVDSSYLYYFKANKLYMKTNDLNGLGITLRNIGTLQYDINDYPASCLSYTKALKILKKTKNKKDIIICEILLANSLSDLKEFDESIKLYKHSLSQMQSVNFKEKAQNKALCLNNLGNTYAEINNYKKEIFYYELALKDKKLIYKSFSTYSLLILNRALSKINNNSFSNEIENELLFILKKEKEIKDSYISFRIRIIFSKFYQKINNIEKAQKYAQEALKIARVSKKPYCILNALREVGFTNINKSQECIDEYDKKIDSLLAYDRKTRSQFYKIQLDVDQITQEKETAVKQKWVVTSMLSGILLIVILLFIIFRQRSKQKEIKLWQDQQKANEETYQMMLNQQALQEEAKTVEKKRVALELHDNILNKLASIRFNLYAITQKKDPETLQNAISHVERIKSVEDEIRTITHDFSNDKFAEVYSFKAILEQLIEEQNKLYPTTHYQLELEEGIHWDSISSKIKMNLYRIIQEALFNIHKHAKASKAVVALIQDEHNICLSIQDNGVGFNPSKIKEGIGIKNIKLRLLQLSGKITINSSANLGTSINAAVPIVAIKQ